jgi:DNA/RNA-binding domain of Phe-tRNA-synthetase-like protein
MVTAATSAALVAIYAPRRSDESLLVAALDLTARRILEYAGGRETLRVVL